MFKASEPRFGGLGKYAEKPSALKFGAGTGVGDGVGAGAVVRRIATVAPPAASSATTTAVAIYGTSERRLRPGSGAGGGSVSATIAAGRARAGALRAAVGLRFAVARDDVDLLVVRRAAGFDVDLRAVVFRTAAFAAGLRSGDLPAGVLLAGRFGESGVTIALHSQ